MSPTEKKNKSSEELALDRTELAEIRSELAQNRTLLSAERTYASWIRTGFAIAGAGWTLGQALQNTEGSNIAVILGGALIILGLMCFVYAWLGYKAVFDYIKKTFDKDAERDLTFRMNLMTVTIMSVVLFVIFLIGFVMLIF